MYTVSWGCCLLCYMCTMYLYLWHMWHQHLRYVHSYGLQFHDDCSAPIALPVHCTAHHLEILLHFLHQTQRRWVQLKMIKLRASVEQQLRIHSQLKYLYTAKCIQMRKWNIKQMYMFANPTTFMQFRFLKIGVQYSIHSPLKSKRNCLHTTKAALLFHKSSHTVPHSPPWQNSTRPLLLL